MNNITIDGYVNYLKQIETSTGTPMAVFSLANSSYGGKNEDGSSRYDKSYIEVVTFGYTAEQLLTYCLDRESIFVTVEGTLVQRNYEDKDGVTRHAFQIKAQDVTRGGPLKSYEDAPMRAAEPAMAGANSSPF